MQINFQDKRRRLLLVNPDVRTGRNYPLGYPPVRGFKAVYDSEVMVSHYRAPIQTNYSRNFFDR